MSDIKDESPSLPVKKDGRGAHLKGRPKGVKNKTTIFKEAMRGQFEELLMQKGQKVFEIVAQRAIEGDMKAAKLLLDRILPVSKAIDLDQLEKSKGLTISVNIGSLEDQTKPIDAEVVEIIEDE